MTFDRRTYAREWRRRRQAAIVADRNLTRVTCGARLGQGECGGSLDILTDGSGGVTSSCRWCARRLAGLCRDCPAPVEGRVGSALRCAEHKRAARLAAGARHTARFLEKRRRSSRNNYRNNPARRQQKNEYKRAWRKANRDKVKLQKRREALKQSPKRLAYHAARRERQKAALALREKQRYHDCLAPRTCLTSGCSTTVKGRVKKCTICKAADAMCAKDVLAHHHGRGRRTDLERVA